MCHISPILILICLIMIPPPQIDLQGSLHSKSSKFELELTLERYLNGTKSSANFEPLCKFNPKPIGDLLLQLKSGLNLLRENRGCKNNILKFDYVDSIYVENENQLGKSSLDLDDDFGVLMMRGMLWRRKCPLLRMLLKVRMFVNLCILFLSMMSLTLVSLALLRLLPS